MDYNHALHSTDEITQQARKMDLTSWHKLTRWVKRLPYGRNRNRTDFSLVLKEKKGTCSSKHALLKKIADLNNISDIELILAIYRMNEFNTPAIGDVLTTATLKYIPEAHCYLQVDGVRVDFTSRNSDIRRIESDILEERIISPDQVSEFKVEYHKTYIRKWLKDTDINISFEELWEYREQCIGRLSTE